MIANLTADEMLAHWRLARGLEPLRADSTVTRTDGVDLDALLMIEIRAWYLNLLDTAPEPMICVDDMAAVTPVIALPDGTAEVSLPPRTRRVLEVKLAGWERPARIVRPADPDAPRLLALQASPWSRGGCCRPVAVMEAGRLRLYSLPEADGGGGASTPVLESLRVVVEPADSDTFRLDTRALPAPDSL